MRVLRLLEIQNHKKQQSKIQQGEGNTDVKVVQAGSPLCRVTVVATHPETSIPGIREDIRC